MWAGIVALRSSRFSSLSHRFGSIWAGFWGFSSGEGGILGQPGVGVSPPAALRLRPWLAGWRKKIWGLNALGAGPLQIECVTSSLITTDGVIIQVGHDQLFIKLARTPQRYTTFWVDDLSNQIAAPGRTMRHPCAFGGFSARSDRHCRNSASKAIQRQRGRPTCKTDLESVVAPSWTRLGGLYSDAPGQGQPRCCSERHGALRLPLAVPGPFDSGRPCRPNRQVLGLEVGPFPADAVTRPC